MRQFTLGKAALLLLFFSICFCTSAWAYEQGNITLDVKDASAHQIFKELKKQTGYSFLYTDDVVTELSKVSMSVKNVSLEEVLDKMFKGHKFSYNIVDKVVIIKSHSSKNAPGQDRDQQERASMPVVIKGKVVNQDGEPLAGATIRVKGTRISVTSNQVGEFTIPDVSENATLEISYVTYESRTVAIDRQSFIDVTLMRSIKELDVTVIKGYYTTTRRLNTGTVARVTGEQIQKQPVTNAISALQGRVPGLVITQTNGLPGSSLNIQLRGQNSIAQGSDPLFVIDGVPFAPNNTSQTQLPSALSSNANGRGISPLNSINAADIESIEILKDADATSIYGSRGANGVILITTKKGKPGKTQINANVYTGFSKVTRTMDLLNTQQYLSMRKEAFANDAIEPDMFNAYDLIVWDTTRYTDFKELLIGGTAGITNAQLSVSGGSATTQFLIGSGFHRETTVFPGDFSYNRGSVHFNISNTSTNRRFNVSLSGNYVFDKNNIIAADLTGILNNVPNFPSLYDSTGNLSWAEKGISFINPLAFLRKTYLAQTNNLNANLQVGYRLFKGLTVSANLGFNRYQVNEESTNPIASQDPSFSPTGFSAFSNRATQGWIIEPQVKYQARIGRGNLQILAGTTFQRNKSTGTFIEASGFTNDDLLKNINSAATFMAFNEAVDYRYNAVFGQANFNWADKYIVNLTGRRDGSSRFGPGNQFSEFGAAGIAWIFSQENFFTNNMKFLSFGKLRGSYGTAGNDQIGDYRYLPAWRSTTWPYQNTPGLIPNNLYNADYSWEIVRKIEAGLDLGFLNDRIFIGAAYFRNRSSSQLVDYNLPTQTGFSSVAMNFPALVQNTGFEIELTTKNIQSESFSWTTSANITLPRNKLLEFPGLETSSYSHLVIGKPLSVYSGFQFAGINPNTGVYEFYSKGGGTTSQPVAPADFVYGLGDLDPTFFGGFLNQFTYADFSLDIFFEFKKSVGTNYLYFLTTNIPGTITNQFENVLDRWQKPGDVTTVQKFTQDFSSPAATAANYFVFYDNDAKYSDASYLRLKNLSFSYNFSERFKQKLHLTTCRIYIQGQNLLTITDYVGADPETRNVTSLPPLKTLTAGIQVTF